MLLFRCLKHRGFFCMNDWLANKAKCKLKTMAMSERGTQVKFCSLMSLS